MTAGPYPFSLASALEQERVRSLGLSTLKPEAPRQLLLSELAMAREAIQVALEGTFLRLQLGMALETACTALSDLGFARRTHSTWRTHTGVREALLFGGQQLQDVSNGGRVVLMSALSASLAEGDLGATAVHLSLVYVQSKSLCPLLEHHLFLAAPRWEVPPQQELRTEEGPPPGLGRYAAAFNAQLTPAFRAATSADELHRLKASIEAALTL